MKKIRTAGFVILWIIVLLVVTPAPTRAQTAVGITGVLNIVWSDAARGSALPPQTLFSLTEPSGSVVPLQISEPLPLPFDQILSLNGKPVIARGYWGSAARSSANGQTFQVISLQANQPVAEPQIVPPNPVTGSQPWVSVLCKFQGETATLQNPAYFQGMFSSTAPGLDNYWREQSYNIINVAGSAATTKWYDLPHPHSYYITSSGSFNLNAALNDCTAAADADVNYPSYKGINMMFSNDLDSYAYGGSQYMTLDGVSNSWRVTWEPPWGYDNIAVIEHEMGHGFGFPHSSFNDAVTYDNVWDVMSDTWNNCSIFSDPTYGCKGQHTITYHKYLAGWISASQRTQVNAGSRQTLTLEQLAQPQTNNLLMIIVPIPGATLFYTVEARRLVGYDTKLPANAVIIHEVDPSRLNPAHVIDLDGNASTADAGAEWEPGETFSDALHGIMIHVDSSTPTGYVVTITNIKPSVFLPFIRR